MDNSPQTPLSTIFTDRSGHPLRIFVEASNVLDRPRLIRTLRSNGAQVETAVKQAEIILVDETVPDSLTFAEQWPDKIILSYRWVHQALREMRFLGAENGWGGHLVGGQPSNSSETRQVLRVSAPVTSDPYICSRSPLPTPRQTPSSEGYPYSIPSGVPVPIASRESVQRLSGSPASFRAPSQPASYSTQVPPQTAAPAYTSENPPYTAQGTAPTLSSLEGALPANLVQTLLDMLAKGAISPAFAPYAQMQNLGQPTAPFPSALPVVPAVSEPYTFNQGAYTDPTLAQPSYYNHSAPQYQSHNPNYGSRSASRSTTPNTHARSGSTKRKSTHQDVSVSPPPHYTGKGKQRSSIHDRPRKQRHRTDSDDDLPEKLPSSPISHSHSNNSRVGDGTTNLFTTKRDVPLQFVVDMTVRNRRDLLLAIKKHGGIIVTNLIQGDYVILSSHADNFEAEIERSIKLNVPAVQADFVYECIRKDAILDEEKFSFDGVMVKGRRGKPNWPLNLAVLREELVGNNEPKPARRKSKKAQETSMKDNKRKSTNDSQHRAHASSVKATPRQGNVSNNRAKRQNSSMGEVGSETPNRASSSAQTFKHMETTDFDTPRSPSPSPPPDMKLVQYSEGRYRFTPDDDEYFAKYVAHLLRGDPDMSVQTISWKLAKRMPHHSDKSWATYARRQQSNEVLEHARKKAWIALRRRRSVEQHQQPATSNEELHTAPDPNLVAEDLDIIVNYLSDGVPDGLSDTEAFATLAQMHPCRVAPTWEQFWDDHNKDILKRLKIVE